jgi:hypothetical protein
VPRRVVVVPFNLPNLDKRLVDSGLVDFKVAAIDQTWSGLRFARKKR